MARDYRGKIMARPVRQPQTQNPKRKKPRRGAGLSKTQCNVSLGCQCVLRLFDDRAKGLGLMHGQIGQNLSLIHI